MNPYDNPQSPHVFHILLALRDGPSHGYAIIGAVEDQSGGRLKLSTGTLYSALKRLLVQGWIRETSAPGSDQRRRAYSLTPAGRSQLVAETARMELMLNAAAAGPTPQGEGA